MSYYDWPIAVAVGYTTVWAIKIRFCVFLFVDRPTLRQIFCEMKEHDSLVDNQFPFLRAVSIHDPPPPPVAVVRAAALVENVALRKGERNQRLRKGISDVP